VRITPDSLLDDVMRDAPATIRVFLDFKFGCVGCPIALFHTVADACREHRVEINPFLLVLRDAAARAEEAHKQL
jgi:hybrid cluster-associated redox disulfide protein